MRTCNYINAPVEIAERLGMTDAPSAGEGRVILTEGDLRMLDMSNEEKIKFFGCEVLTETQALELVDKAKKALPKESSEPNESQTQEENNE